MPITRLNARTGTLKEIVRQFNVLKGFKHLWNGQEAIRETQRFQHTHGNSFDRFALLIGLWPHRIANRMQFHQRM